jgi:hypothetical protein
MMSDPTFDDLTELWDAVDPVPEGLVARMQVVAAAEADLVSSDFDYELMLLVERSSELAGARGSSSAYTLRFAYDDIDLLVRAVGANDTPPLDSVGTRIDGWVVPPGEITVRAQYVTRDGGPGDREWESNVDGNGRFEFRDLPRGMVRLWLTPGGGGKPIATPTFEI